MPMPAAEDAISPASVTIARRHLLAGQTPLGWKRLAGFLLALGFAAGLFTGFASYGSSARRYETALRLMDNGNDEGVFYASLNFCDNGPCDAEKALLQAHLALRGGQPKVAIHLLEAATESPRTRWRALVLSGAAWFNMGRLKDATTAWRAALAGHEDDIELHRSLAACYFDLGAMGPAQHHLERWIQLSPNDPRPHRMMATIYKDFSRLPQATEHYVTVVKLLADDPGLERFIPDLPQMFFELASCLANQGRYDEALQVLAQCEPTASVHALRATCLMAQGNLDLAEQSARSALDLAPTCFPALLASVDLALERDAVTEALSFAERTVAAYPNDSSARQRLGLVYRQLGREEEAAEELRKMETFRDLRLRFTDLHTRAGAAPNDPNVRYELGQVAHALALDDLAIDWFKAALSIDPNHHDAQRALEEVLGTARE